MNKDERDRVAAEIAEIRNAISGMTQELAFCYEVTESDWKIINWLKELVRLKEDALYKS